MNIPTLQPMLGAQAVQRTKLIEDQSELQIEEERPKDELLKIPQKDLKHRGKALDRQTQELIDIKNSIVPYSDLMEVTNTQSTFKTDLEQAMRDLEAIQYAVKPKNVKVTDQDSIAKLQSTIKAELE